MDDDMIIDLYLARSESAISETALKYGGYCVAIALNILKSKEDSEECVNDTYFKAWSSIPPQHPKIFSAFLGRITRNLSLNRYKERNAQKRGGNEVPLLLSELGECISSGANTNDEYESGVIAETISSFLYSASPENRVVFVRRYWYADSIASIAERLCMSESKVKSMLFRMRRNLKAYLEKEGVFL